MTWSTDSFMGTFFPVFWQLVRTEESHRDYKKIAKMANCKTLVLNHLIPNDDPDYDPEIWLREASQYWNGPIIVGNDGLEIGL